MRLKKELIIIAVLTLFSACNPKLKELEEEMVIPKPGELMADINEELSGGKETVFDHSVNAFGFQSPALEGDDELLFFVGNSFFNQNWVAAPASTKARDGLGPFFNARSCASCHFKDGRGRPNIGNEKGRGLLLRLSIPGFGNHGSPKPEAIYGGQLQDQSILNIESQGNFEIVYEEKTGVYPDGSSYSLRNPSYKMSDLSYGSLDAAVQISPRVAPQMIGLGLLDAIDESTILSFADENDADQDGISGKANYVWNVVQNMTSIGKFGWKANQPDILQQTAGAFNGDIGITSYVFPKENCVTGLDCSSYPSGGEKEIDDDDLDKVVLYSSALAVPSRRDWKNRDVLVGKYYFNAMGCGSCHIPKITTGTHERFPGFSNQVIRPYTDVLLHDMGEGLADGRADFLANGNEWRTPPLWGIGLFQTVNKHTFYMHDGRARNLEEAILWHGGEAEKSKLKFMNLEKTDRESLIKFLNSL